MFNKIPPQLLQEHKKQYKKEVLKLAGKVYEAIELGIENITIDFSSFSGGYVLKAAGYWSYGDDAPYFFDTNFSPTAYNQMQDLARWWTYAETIANLDRRIEHVKSHIKMIEKLIKDNK